MKRIVFAFPGNELLAGKIIESLDCEKGELVSRKFPDDESYIRVLSEVKHKHIIIVCSLAKPDKTILALLFLCRLLKDMDVASVCLVTPYLPYMRQDKQFNPGEAVTSRYFSALLSSAIDHLITVDPHLHRIHSLNDIYNINCITLHTADHIANWIRKNISNPVFIGPDSESQQWVSGIANAIGAPYLVLNKVRHGDRTVEISIPQLNKYADHIPVVIDDIISTARTMAATIKHLREAGTLPPISIAIHALFSGEAFEELKNSGVQQIITCNTIEHETNRIDVSPLITSALKGIDVNHYNH